MTRRVRVTGAGRGAGAAPPPKLNRWRNESNAINQLINQRDKADDQASSEQPAALRDPGERRLHSERERE